MPANNSYLLDTHIWVWFHTRPEKLPKDMLDLISGHQYDGLYLSTISIWEVCKLNERGRLKLSMDPHKWIKEALDITDLHLAEITPDIACASCSLPGNFHQDPADQIIVATAREMGIPILTVDARIREYPYVQIFSEAITKN